MLNTDSIFQNNYKRIKTIGVHIGKVMIGGRAPIVIQSMATADTMDTKKIINEIIRIKNAGAKLVRVTAPNLKAAENLENIKNLLEQKKHSIPLVADIHFTPKAAEIAARIVEKVRINPGNYIDRKKFDLKKYSDKEYKQELKRIEERFIPLIEICKKHQTALRIGTNHGSLSDRIVSQYGDNPKGMVESAFEFIRICEKENFDQIVISMKSSNPIIMTQAYRLLSQKMRDKNQKHYPLHLGVTEAGDGEEGRVKSAIGIGSLLADGIGDTIRVSLTEDSEKEIPVCKKIIQYFDFKKNDLASLKEISSPINLYEFSKRKTKSILNIGAENVPKIVLSSSNPILKESDLNPYQITKEKNINKWQTQEFAPDLIFLTQKTPFLYESIGIPFVLPYLLWEKEIRFKKEEKSIFPYYDSFKDFLEFSNKSKKGNFVVFSIEDLNLLNSKTEKTLKENLVILILKATKKHVSQEIRNVIFHLDKKKILNPIILFITHKDDNSERRILNSSLKAGPLLIDGLLDGLWMQEATPKDIKNGFNIFQATRSRISKPDYISCPSCGRTLFDLQEITAKIKSKTSHLKGVKIAIMGCIVNGPGEMADADFGYVGSGVGKITLYKKREIVKRNIPSEKAVDALINLLKENGAWIEPN